MSEEERGTVEENRYRATATAYISRQARHTHPIGTFSRNRYGTVIRWEPAATERSLCCDRVTAPTPQNPWTLNRHCRTIGHLARLNNLHVGRLTRMIHAMQQESLLEAVDGTVAGTDNRHVGEQEAYNLVFNGYGIIRDISVSEAERNRTRIRGQILNEEQGICNFPAWSDDGITPSGSAQIRLVMNRENNVRDYTVLTSDQRGFHYNEHTNRWMYIGRIVSLQMDTSLGVPPTRNFDIELESQLGWQMEGTVSTMWQRRIISAYGSFAIDPASSFAEALRDSVRISTVRGAVSRRLVAESAVPDGVSALLTREEIANHSVLYIQILKSLKTFNNGVYSKSVYRMLDAYKSALTAEEQQEIEAKFLEASARWRP